MTTHHPAPRWDYPDWVPRLVALPPTFFALVSITGAGPAWPVVTAAVTAAVLPWLIGAVRPGLVPTSVFAAWVILPIAALQVTGAAGTAANLSLTGDSHVHFTLMILVWLMGEMAARGTPAQMAGAGLATVATILVPTFAGPGADHGSLFWIGGSGVAMLTGYLLRRQQQTVSELRRAQAALAGEAAQRERQRIAREVHDVVAHSLTVTLLHVRTARRALDRDPAHAREALDRAEELGRRSLADIRRTVGLLRSEDEALETHALPDAADLPALVSSTRDAGVALDAELDGDLAGLPPSVSLSLYRIVQEAISNAANHAPGQPVRLRVRVGRAGIDVVVSNPVPPGTRPGGGGLGVVGMRERIALLGGSVDVDRRDGRWTVTARLPLDRTVDAEAPA